MSIAPDTLLLLAAAATFLLAGLVKGVIGLGLPTIAMGLLSLVMPPTQAATLLIVPSLVTNLWQLAAGPRFGPLLRRLWPMMLAIALGTLAGSGTMTDEAGGAASIVLGTVLVLYGLLGLSVVRVTVPKKAEPVLAPLIGAATGLLTAATGVFVIPAVPYLGALGLAKEDLIQALGLSFTVSTVALAGALAIGGGLHMPVAGASLLALVPALAGMVVGGWVRNRVSDRLFRRCFFTGLIPIGIDLAMRGLF